MGGLLSDPVRSYPNVFGDDSIFGGDNGVWWPKHWPYALPNMISATFLFISAMGVAFGLEVCMLPTTSNHQFEIYKLCRGLKLYETNQTWVFASATPSPTPSVTFSAATLTTTPPSALTKIWTRQ